MPDGMYSLPTLLTRTVPLELDVGLGGAEPDVGAERHLQIVDPQRIEEPVLEPGAELLAADERGVDQVGDGRVLEVDDPLVDQVGEVDARRCSP